MPAAVISDGSWLCISRGAQMAGAPAGDEPRAPCLPGGAGPNAQLPSGGRGRRGASNLSAAASIHVTRSSSRLHLLKLFTSSTASCHHRRSEQNHIPCCKERSIGDYTLSLSSPSLQGKVGGRGSACVRLCACVFWLACIENRTMNMSTNPTAGLLTAPPIKRSEGLTSPVSHLPSPLFPPAAITSVSL